MRRYLVVVRLPDSVDDTPPLLLYSAYVESHDTMGAVGAAVREAHAAQSPDRRGRLANYRALLVYDGHPNLVLLG